MKEENKKTGVDNKIMSFQIKDEEIQDPEMDRFVRESLIREADELAEKINAKPELSEIEAPDSMFQAIVKELKERGVWEEDSAEESAAGNDAYAGEGESDLEALYAKLPEEDRKALALGKEIAQKREKKARKRRRRRKIFRIAGVVAACFVVVFGISMTSDANRRLVKRMWDGWMIDFGFRINTNYVGDDETIRSKSAEEVEAMKTISEKLGSPPIDLAYLPDGMQYEGYEMIDEFQASLFYSYQDVLFYVTLMDVSHESSYYYVYDNKAVMQEKVINNSGADAKIWEVNLDLGKKAYVAEMKYNGWRYILNGMLSLDEFKKIVKNTTIL